jgi:hypothetical protein
MFMARSILRLGLVPRVRNYVSSSRPFLIFFSVGPVIGGQVSVHTVCFQSNIFDWMLILDI